MESLTTAAPTASSTCPRVSPREMPYLRVAMLPPEKTRPEGRVIHCAKRLVLHPARGQRHGACRRRCNGQGKHDVVFLLGVGREAEKFPDALFLVRRSNGCHHVGLYL